jgi:Cu/Ag efflux protein CusF
MKSLIAAALLLVPFVALGQNPMAKTNTMEATAEIVAIDHDARLVTLRSAEGDEDTIYCGPGVKRFDELKVGDKVTFTYYESLVTSIRKPGESAPMGQSGAAKLVRGTGAKPGATLSQQLSATVTVTAIDSKVPSVTVKTEEGRTMSFKVEDKKNLEKVKVGDKVDITYTAAMMIAVK